MSRRAIGLFGGTFDPVHMGHLRMALELKQQVELDEMRLLPCHIPPHRRAPVAGPEARTRMVELAIAECPELCLDRLELNNPAPSYSVHTLEVLRRREGDDTALCLAMGMDSLASLDTWHQWQRLLELGHLLVAARPGWELPRRGPVADLLARHRDEAAALRRAPAGSIVIQELSLLPISASDIRRQTAAGHSSQFLMPDRVWAYILRQGLYRAPKPPESTETSSDR